MSDKYTADLEKAVVDLLVTYRDREAGDSTQLMTVATGIAALARIVNQGSKRRDYREHAAEVYTFVTGLGRDWMRAVSEGKTP